ncbi:MAG: 2OG-Fe(II) oxygenase [Cytophagaceae bacterium]|jgi:SM-20-related protein|nr:2OG-Fe(II) oxygenase [Cytophagaceae bacterium]
MNEIPDWMEALADELAEKRYSVVDHFISNTLTEELLAALKQEQESGTFHQASIGRQQDQQIRTDIRGDYILWLDQCLHLPAVQAYLEKVNLLIKGLNRTLFLGLQESEIHFAYYPTGTYYKRHLDRFKSSSRRTLSIITYLNSNWKDTEGGALVVYIPSEEQGEKEKKITILPEAGRMVIFDSALLEHEVIPATRERYSVTGWMLR